MLVISKLEMEDEGSRGIELSYGQSQGLELSGSLSSRPSKHSGDTATPPAPLLCVSEDV